MSDHVVRRVHEAVRAAVGGVDRVVLAVSGGVDSMTLLDAGCAVLPTHRIVVATFDHGTGAYAAAAVAHVQHEAAKRGVGCLVERASTPLAGLFPGWKTGYRAARVFDELLVRMPLLRGVSSNFEIIATKPRGL